MTKVVKWTGVPASETKSFEIEYRYCPSCSGALSARIKKDGDGDIVSWLRYEYSGLQLLRIDEVYDADSDGTLEDPADEQDAWRILNLYMHSGSPLPISAKWFSYRTPNSGIYCDTGTYYYMYDAVGNVNGVVQNGNYYRWEMDAYGNDLNGRNSFLPMDSPGPKEHITGKLYDTDTGLYYFNARWLNPECSVFISRSRESVEYEPPYGYCYNNPNSFVDPTGSTPEMGEIWARGDQLYIKVGDKTIDLGTCDSLKKIIDKMQCSLTYMESLGETGSARYKNYRIMHETLKTIYTLYCLIEPPSTRPNGELRKLPWYIPVIFLAAVLADGPLPVGDLAAASCCAYMVSPECNDQYCGTCDVPPELDFDDPILKPGRPRIPRELFPSPPNPNEYPPGCGFPSDPFDEIRLYGS